MRVLRLDFETYGTVDLPVRGLHNYATDKNTGVWCLGYAFDDEPVEVWVNRHDMRHGRLAVPTRIIRHIEEGLPVYAYNVRFEWYLWNFVLRRQYPNLPELNMAQCHCTQAESLAMSLPDSLDKCGAALGLPIQKDQRGFSVMMQLCKPQTFRNGEPIWHTDPEKFDILYEYCKTDVATEREMSKRVRRLSPDMYRVWLVDFVINFKGVHLDSESIALCKPLVEAQKAAYSAELAEITGGVVTKTTQHKRMKDWCVAQGCKLDSVGKPARAALFEEDEQQGGFAGIPPQVIKALHVWDDAAFSSTAKLERAQDLICADGRLRGMYQYHAAGTGRFGGRGVQTQNLTRPPKGWTRKHALELFTIVKQHHSDGMLDALRLYYGNPVAVISASLRALFMAEPGMELNSSDLSGIESRGLAYLAGEQWKLDAHAAADAGTARDVYCVVYAQSFGIKPEDVDDYQRQIGKVEDLSCGYQGWVGAFANMAKVYGVKLSEEKVIEVIKAFRQAHPATVKLWEATERAAVRAVINPGEEFSAGKHLKFYKDGSFLFMVLPSGREIAYPYPKVVTVERFGKTRQQVEYYGVDTKTKQWMPQRTYGGFWCENATQAFAFDVFAHGLVKAHEAGLDIVMHTHDEITVESKQPVLKKLAACMASVPEWSTGLPLSSKGWINERYWK